ncbi:uncharacterized protein [Miscanthus floridulus]|uniref:uncharacterized protein n=1 Tax=Miscanthus floridulus TaxID=154761 RepID=UPI003459D2CB
MESQVPLYGRKKPSLKRLIGFQYCPSDPKELMVTSCDSQKVPFSMGFMSFPATKDYEVQVKSLQHLHQMEITLFLLATKCVLLVLCACVNRVTWLCACAVLLVDQKLYVVQCQMFGYSYVCTCVDANKTSLYEID